MTMATVLNLHHATVIQHLKKIRAKAVRVTGWNLPMWGGRYQHLYISGEVVQTRSVHA